MISMTYDIIVVGGGIIGLSAAYELAKEGLTVLLLEKRSIGSGASGNSAAMLECQVDAFRGDPFFSLARASNGLFPSIYHEIKSLTGIDFEYERSGILQLAMTEDDATFLQNEVRRQTNLGMRAQWISPENLREDLPEINPFHFGGAFYEEDGQVNGLKYLTAMQRAAELKGIKTIENISSLTFTSRAGLLTGVHTNKGRFSARQFLVAAGAWTDQVLKQLDIQLGLEPIRGQMVIYETKERPLPHPLYTRSRGYITPKRDGLTYVGATIERTGFNEETTDQAKQALVKQAEILFPHLSHRKVLGATSGLRPGTPDDLPYIGPLPHTPNCFVAAGHYRNGILLAPITSKIISSLIMGRPVPIDIEPYAPSRALSDSVKSAPPYKQH